MLIAHNFLSLSSVWVWLKHCVPPAKCSWTHFLLTFNSSKTEFLLVGLKQQLAKIYNSSLNTIHSVRDLGFIYDERLSLSDRVSSLSKYCISHVRRTHPLYKCSQGSVVSGNIFCTDIRWGMLETGLKRQRNGRKCPLYLSLYLQNLKRDVQNYYMIHPFNLLIKSTVKHVNKSQRWRAGHQGTRHLLL